MLVHRVRMFPGAMQLNRIPSRANSSVMALDISSTAPFVAQYAALFGKPTWPAIDEMKITEPSGRRCGVRRG